MKEPLLQRSLYSENQRLTAADLENQQLYEREQLLLHNRVLHGVGVVSGLGLRYDSTRGIVLAPGFALDAQGQELYVPTPRTYPVAGLCGALPAGTRDALLYLRHVEWKTGRGFALLADGTHQEIPNRVAEAAELCCRPEGAAAEDGVLLAACSIRWDEEAHTPHIEVIRPVACGVRAPCTEEATGVVEIRMDTRRPGDRTFYSQEVPHGLGPGVVQVTLSAEGRIGGRTCLVSGETALFLHGFKLAVLLFPDDGAFCAAVKLHEGFYQSQVLRLHWYASRVGPEPDRAWIPAQEQVLLFEEPAFGEKGW